MISSTALRKRVLNSLSRPASFLQSVVTFAPCSKCPIPSSWWARTTQFLPADEVAELIDRHGADRIVFGTDWPWTDQAESIEGIRSLGLADDVLSKILGRNAAELLGPA